MNDYENYEIDEINDFEDLETIESNTEARERFKIINLETANWAFRKIKALKSRIGEKERLAQEEIKRIEEWKQKEVNADKKTVSFFITLLVDYYILQKEKDAKFKLSTPYGTVKSRKQQPQWDFDDNAVEELKKLGLTELILTKTEETINKSMVKKELKIVNGKAVTKYGEVVEGIKITDRPPIISISIDERR